MLGDSELEGSDVDDVECTFEEQQQHIRIGNTVLSLEEEQFVESDSEEEDFEGWSTDKEASQNGVDQWKWTTKENVEWCKGIVNKQNFEYQQVDCEDTEDDYFSPATYFMKYIPESLFDDMVTYTNIYAAQNDAKKWKPADKNEMKKFVGLQVMMGNLKLPRIEMYYGRELQLKMFQDSIPLYRFYLLRTNFHLINVQTIPANYSDKFVRVRPLMDSVRKRCLQLPVEEYLSIDEQMIPMRGRGSEAICQK